MSNLADLATTFTKTKYYSASDPTTSVGSIKDLHTNSTSGEVFCCTKSAPNAEWQGSLGTVVGGSSYTANLIAKYSMDSISGTTLLDETANGHDGNVLGAPTIVAGKISNAIGFDKVDDRIVTTPKVVSTSSFTVALWSYISILDGANGGWFINQRDSTSGTSQEWQLVYFGGFYTIGLFTTNGYFECVSTTAATQDVWRHLTFSFSGSEIKLYIDGVLEGTTAVTGSLNTGASKTVFGMRAWDLDPVLGGPNMYGGLIDSVRILDTVASQAQVTEIYNETS